MPVLIDEVMEIVRSRGLDGEDRQDWVQIPAGPARRFSKRIYVRRARGGRPVLLGSAPAYVNNGTAERGA